MDVIVRPDWFVDEERHRLGAVEERSTILTEQDGGSIYAERIDVSLDRVRTPVGVLAGPSGAFFGIERDPKIITTFGKEAQRDFARVHP
jgi:hypothetical protein